MYYVFRNYLRYVIPEVILEFARSGKCHRPLAVIADGNKVRIFGADSPVELSAIEDQKMTLAVTYGTRGIEDEILSHMDVVPIPGKQDKELTWHTQIECQSTPDGHTEPELKAVTRNGKIVGYVTPDGFWEDSASGTEREPDGHGSPDGRVYGVIDQETRWGPY